MAKKPAKAAKVYIKHEVTRNGEVTVVDSHYAAWRLAMASWRPGDVINVREGRR